MISNCSQCNKRRWVNGRGRCLECVKGETPISYQEIIQDLESRLAKAVGALKSLRVEHHETCVDSWYSCPASGECCNSQYDGIPIEELPCYCDKEDNNKIIDSVLTEIEGA